MLSRRVILLLVFTAIAASSFALGVLQARADAALDRASQDARFDALRAEIRSGRPSPRAGDAQPTGTAGRTGPRMGVDPATSADRTRLVEQVKQELQHEMGLLPVQLLRERRASFVELYSEDNLGKTSYGTAGYLGRGYFVTVKHAVVAFRSDDNRDGSRRIVAIRVLHHGTELPAELIDAGDAEAEVHRGDWAIIRTRDVPLPPLRPNAAFGYEFAEPIFRFGNDYSKGVIVSTGYVGQRMPNGLVTALTDGHPGVSGGGVLNRDGDLVGIPIGRMEGDFRFSFILPIRAEMLRRIQER